MTTAKGFSWTTTSAPASSSRYDDIWFVSPKVGWAVNNQGLILKTTNGGEAWKVQYQAKRTSSNRSVYLRCVGFSDENNGWVGTTTQQQRMYRTTDGGDDWGPVDNLPETDPNKICGLCVVNGDVIYASGTNNPGDGAGIIKTTDGGNTWTTLPMGEHASSLIDIYFTSPEQGWVVGGHTTDSEPAYNNVQPVILRTEDGGQTWVNQIPKVGKSFPKGTWGWKIQFLSSEVGFVSLENFNNAYVLKTVNGGESWSRIDVSGNANLEGIGMLTEQHGWVGGWGDADFESGRTSVTDDGGETWRDASDIGRFINRFRFIGDPLVVGYASGRSVYKYAPADEGGGSPPDDTGPGQGLLGPRGVDVSFSHSLPIKVRVPRGTQRVTIDVWDRFTNEVGRVVDLEDPAPGKHSFVWDGTSEAGEKVAPGVYLFRVSADDDVADRVVTKSAAGSVPTWDQIKGYFDAQDRQCMQGSFDLGDCNSVLDNAADIYDAVEGGSMPLGGERWSNQWVQDFYDWWKSDPVCSAASRGVRRAAVAELSESQAATAAPNWETIKSYFRNRDRNCMLRVSGGEIDLWDCSSVLENAGDIYDQLDSGGMPPDGRWSDERIHNFYDWWKSDPVCPGTSAKAAGGTAFAVELASGHRIRVPSGFDSAELRRLCRTLEE